MKEIIFLYYTLTGVNNNLIIYGYSNKNYTLDKYI